MPTQFKRAYVRLCSDTNGHWFAHPDLRPRLVADAREQETSMTEVVLQILCDHLKLKYEPSGRRADPQPNEKLLNLRLPWRVFSALSRKYAPENYQDALRRVLCEHYSLEWGGPARHVEEVV